MTTSITKESEHFHLEGTGLRVTGNPSISEWEQFGEALSKVDGAIHWWIGDWVNYGEGKYGEKYAQALNELRFSYEVLKNDAWIANTFELSRRHDKLSWSHHQAVASSSKESQDKLLNEAEENGWTVRELRQRVRLLTDKTIAALPEGKYRVLYADPPWEYGDKLIEGYGAAEHHYPSLSIEELADLPVKDLAGPDAVLFLWVTSPLLADVPVVIEAWDFEYKTSFIWDKVKHNYGHYNSVRHELLLLCTRGSCIPETNKLFDSVVTVERTEKHSEKPEEFRKIIETLYPTGPRIELFARKEVPGWQVWGNEV